MSRFDAKRRNGIRRAMGGRAPTARLNLGSGACSINRAGALISEPRLPHGQVKTCAGSRRIRKLERRNGDGEEMERTERVLRREAGILGTGLEQHSSHCRSPRTPTMIV